MIDSNVPHEIGYSYSNSRGYEAIPRSPRIVGNHGLLDLSWHSNSAVSNNRGHLELLLFSK